MSIYEKITEIIFPKKCAGCGQCGFLICGACKDNLSAASNLEYEFITSVFSYSNPAIRRMIHMLKYENGRYVAKFFAPYLLESLYEFMGEEKLFHGKSQIVLVPIPLSKKRMKARGYNQSELLIKEMMKKDSRRSFLVDKKLVAKIKDTIPQAHMKKRSFRLTNQADCFRVLPHKKTKNEIIILIDDVTTTGATLGAVRDALKKDGFKKVYALTIAH